jgi:hypothetical protein
MQRKRVKASAEAPNDINAVHPDRRENFRPTRSDFYPPTKTEDIDSYAPTNTTDGGSYYPPTTKDGDYYRPSPALSDPARLLRENHSPSHYTPSRRDSRASRSRKSRDNYRPQPSDGDTDTERLSSSRRRLKKPSDGRLSPWEDMAPRVKMPPSEPVDSKPHMEEAPIDPSAALKKSAAPILHGVDAVMEDPSDGRLSPWEDMAPIVKLPPPKSVDSQPPLKQRPVKVKKVIIKKALPQSPHGVDGVVDDPSSKLYHEIDAFLDSLAEEWHLASLAADCHIGSGVQGNSVPLILPCNSSQNSDSLRDGNDKNGSLRKRLKLDPDVVVDEFLPFFPALLASRESSSASLSPEGDHEDSMMADSDENLPRSEMSLLRADSSLDWLDCVKNPDEMHLSSSSSPAANSSDPVGPKDFLSHSDGQRPLGQYDPSVHILLGDLDTWEVRKTKRTTALEMWERRNAGDTKKA